MAPTIDLEAPLPTMAPTATPTGMSSRLMTMKFMQRGEASAKSSPSATPKTDNEGSAKRRKTAHKNTPDAKPLYDEVAVKAALDEEESKRQAAIARRAKELGDEQWVLNAGPVAAPNVKQHNNLNYVQVGFAQIDSGFPSDEDNDNVTGLAGRRQFNMKASKKRASVGQLQLHKFIQYPNPHRNPSRKVIVAAIIPPQTTSQVAAAAHRPMTMIILVLAAGSHRVLRPATERGHHTPCQRGARRSASRHKSWRLSAVRTKSS